MTDFEKAQDLKIDIVSEDDESISEEHKQYLISKHGRYDLIPLPSMNDDDPLNWSPWFKHLQLGMVATHGFFGTFFASGLVPSFGKLSEKFELPTSQISYLTSAQIVILGFFPLVWVPLMNKYGKRKLLILSVVGSMCFNLGCVFSNTYGTLMAMRCLVAFFISPGLAVGGSIVHETTFSHQRGSRSGVWALMVNLGTMAGALFMGFVAQYQDVKYVFVVFTVMNFFQIFFYVFLGKETLYNYQDLSRNENNRFKQLTSFSAIVPERSFNFPTVAAPFKLFGNWRVFIAALAYGICFMHDNIATNVEIPQVMYIKFQLGPQALGLQFLSFIVGSLIGEVGGWLSDKWVQWGRKNNRGNSFRIWITYPGFITSIIGIVEFGVQIDRAEHKWNITPLIGLAISAFGFQILTSPLIAYSMDTTPTRASEVALFMTMMRQTLGFIGPFYYPLMFENMGFTRAYGLMAGLMAALAFIPVLFMHLYEARKGR
ncbi:Efflux pump vrtL [Spathaspora sp. JA1]|nr:Efflux pump vrtL [Spathaspora sp. JA1]